jgi:hypothetical protein
MPADALVRLADKLHAEHAKTPTGELFVDENAKLDFWRSKVKQAAGMMAKNVIAIRAASDGERFERSLLGDTIRAIHAEWMHRSGSGHDAMTASEIQKKYEWIRSTNETLKGGAIPQWLRV